MKAVRFTVTLLAVILTIPFAALAAEYRVGEDVSVPKSESNPSNLYLAGGSVTSGGPVGGDLVLVGGSVLVGGPVGGDVISGSGDLSIEGRVSGDVRAVGGDVRIRSDVGGDVIAAGGQVRIDGAVGGDVAIGAGTVTVDGPITGSVRIAASRAVIRAPIGGDVRFTGEELVLGEGARIGGSLAYSAPEEARISDGVTVAGGTTYDASGTRKAVEDAAKAGIIAFLSLWLIAKTFGLIISALVIGLVFRRFSEELVKTVSERPFIEFVRGFATAFLLPIAAVILLVSLVGIPLGVLALLSVAALVIFAHLASPIVVGALIRRYVTKADAYVIDWKTVVLGTAAYIFIGLVPLVGPLAKLLIVFATLGAIIAIKLRVASEWR